MSEAPRGDHDSRPGEDQRASSEQQAPDGDSYTWYRRGLDLLGRGSPAAAAQLLERAAEAEPGARSVLEALARAQFDTGRYAEAADSFRQIVEASPSDDYAHFGLGLALARGGDPAAAAEHLALAAAMRPDLRHYTEALRGVRATLRARAEAGAAAAVQPDPAGDEPA
jgi:tetratricopeptide (TPR) repeat protein